MSDSEKVRENRLRRKAERQGLRLSKSLRRDPDALGYGRYCLWAVDPERVVAGLAEDGEHRAFTLDDVERWLKGEGRDDEDV